MDYVDVKYINLLSYRLEKFVMKNQNLYNCRCNLCGDSKRNKNKARGFFYSVRNNTNYKCHNCGINISLNNYLKLVDATLHQEYCLEKYVNGHTGKNFSAETPEFNFKTPEFKTSIDLPRASENEISKKYLEDRKINSSDFYYAQEFKKWVNSISPVFKDTKLDEPRIVIPLYYNKKLIGIQGRALKNSPVKYITIKLSENSPKIYGLDDVKKEEPVYVLEGVFDSYFIKNSIAMCGADVTLDGLNISQPVYVYDNEPRNKEIHDRMVRQIENGNSIVIWPSYIEHKDVNNMILSGLDVQSIIESNIYSNLTAKVKFNEWKKV
jgi:hypothetical protein